MPRHCCVPGCSTNYSSSLKSEGMLTTFSFPKDEQLRQAWIRSIHRDKFVVTSCSVVCEKHFDKIEINRVESYKNKDGILCEFPLKRPTLQKGAVPHIFPNQPKYFTTPSAASRRDPEIRRQAALSKEKEKIEAFLKSDNINSFDEFCECFKTKISLREWEFKVMNRKVYFFLLNACVDDLDFSESLNVICSIVINNELLVQVFIENSELTINELRWILSEDKKLNRWSQLENILSRYRCTRYIPNDCAYYVEKAHKTVQEAIKCVDGTENLTILQLLSDQLLLIYKKKELQYGNYSVFSNSILSVFFHI